MSAATGNHLLGLEADNMTAWESETTVSISRFQQAIKHVGSEPGCWGLNPYPPAYGLYELGEGI